MSSISFSFLIVVSLVILSGNPEILSINTAEIVKSQSGHFNSDDNTPTPFPTLYPTHSSTVKFLYQQILVGISPNEFSGCSTCKDVFASAVVSFLGELDVSEVSIAWTTSAPAPPAKQAKLQYSAPVHYVGDHDKFLEIAASVNEVFVTSVENGTFTSVLQRKAESAGEAAALMANVSSRWIIVLDVDHMYNSPCPTLLPTSQPGALEFYQTARFKLVIFVIILAVGFVLLFCLGYNCCERVEKVKVTVHVLQKSLTEAKPDDKYVESSSESEQDFSDDEVYQYQPAAADPGVSGSHYMY